MIEWNQDTVALLPVTSRWLSKLLKTHYLLHQCFGQIRKRFKSVRTPLKAESSDKVIDVILGLEENVVRLLSTIILSGSVIVQRFPVKDERINTVILSYSIGVLNSKAKDPVNFLS